MNEATFPAGPSLACSDGFQQTGRMEPCGRPEAWKHDTQPSRLDSSLRRLAQPLKAPPLGLPMYLWWSKIHFAGRDTPFPTPRQLEQKNASAFLCPSLACCWCLSGRRMATVPRLSGADVPRAPPSSMYRYLTGAEMGCAPCSAVARVAPALSNPRLDPTLHHQPRL